MPCANHPDVLVGLETCAGCGKVFCPDCVVQLRGETVCASCKLERVKDIKSGVTDDGFELAGRGVRFAAAFIDGLLLFGIIVGVFLLFGIGIIFTKPERGADYTIISTVVGVLLGVAYEGIFLGLWSKTLGKMACSIRVVTSGGERIGHGRAWGRAFARQIMAATRILGLIDSLMIFGADRRTLHDRMAATRVVKDA